MKRISTDTKQSPNNTLRIQQMRLKQSDSWKALQITGRGPIYLSQQFEDIKTFSERRGLTGG